MFDDKPTIYNGEAHNKPLKNPVSAQTLTKVRQYRLKRVREQLIKHDCAAILLFDPINIRYATDVSNMQVWVLHNPTRYAIINTHGPTMAFEYSTTPFLAEGLVDEIYIATTWFYFTAGDKIEQRAKKWAQEVASIVKKHGGNNKRLAIDNCNPEGAYYLKEEGITIVNGQSLMEQARYIKSAEELKIIDWTMCVCNKGMDKIYANSLAGKSENEIWAELHYENIRHGGEWIETRLLSSGPRTNPWMQECNDRIVQNGDILSFDTDLIGPYGYCADISRSWTIGHTKPTDSQKELYKAAYEHIHYNMSVLKAGMTFREFIEKSWIIPEKYNKRRYSVLAHGVGLCDEYPSIGFIDELKDSPCNDDIFEENATICIESYIGEEGGKEGVKLEIQVLVEKNGCRRLDTYPFNEDWL